MVDSGEGAVSPADLAASVAKALKGLRGGNLVNEVAVDVDESVTVSGLDDVVVEDLVVEGSRGGRGHDGNGYGEESGEGAVDGRRIIL